MKAGRIILMVFGILIVITSFGLLISGGIITALQNNFRDANGFYSTNRIEVESKSTAIVTEPAEINTDGVWIRTHNLATLKIEATNIQPDKPVFIGIARTSAITDYLEGISYSETRDIYAERDRLMFHTYQGLDHAPAPTQQHFWVASASGTGSQTLEWDVTSGRYSVVLMNADGSSPIDADVSLGVKVPAVFNAVGTVLLVTGGVLLVGGSIMIFFGARGW
jgi:hypothetical protein